MYDFDETQASKYLHALWPNDIPKHNNGVLFALPERSVWVYPSIEHLLRLLPNVYGMADMYVHMGTVGDHRSYYTRNTRPTSEEVEYITSVWADLDPKGIGRDELLEWLIDMPFKPSMLVDTGNGYHAYWLLREPLARVPAKALVQGFQQWLQGQAHWHIDSTFDLARVLRIPGTWNYKDPRNPKPVEIVSLYDNLRYDPSEFPVIEQADLPVVTRVLPDVIPEGGKLDSSGRDDTLFKLLCAMRRFGCTEAMLVTIANAFNEHHLEPPLPERVVARKVQSAMRYTPRTEVDYINQRAFNEQAAARFLKG